FRSALAEILLSRILKISVSKDMILEMIMVLIFLIASWFLSFWSGLLLYLSAYSVYVIIKKKDIIYTLKYIEKMLRKEEGN
ncbi:hypothetical protein AC739_18930, partial [Planococcus glaciei]